MTQWFCWKDIVSSSHSFTWPVYSDPCPIYGKCPYLHDVQSQGVGAYKYRVNNKKNEGMRFSEIENRTNCTRLFSVVWSCMAQACHKWFSLTLLEAQLIMVRAAVEQIHSWYYCCMNIKVHICMSIDTINIIYWWNPRVDLQAEMAHPSALILTFKNGSNGTQDNRN